MNGEGDQVLLLHFSLEGCAITAEVPLETLKRYFGYSQFRPGQREVIDSILSGQDTIALMPTGGGKSLCFQIPALLLPGMTVVISPLISLMKDQVDALQARGVAATYLNSSLSAREFEERVHGLRNHQYQLLYISPEGLWSDRSQVITSSRPISLVVIDEAHCISQWGPDFRPEYLQIHSWIAKLKQTHPSQPLPITAAFTATATAQTLAVIQDRLGIPHANIFRQSFARPNLFIATRYCRQTRHKEILLLRLVKKHSAHKTLIYCTTRERAQETSQFLTQLGYRCGYYHGDLSALDRTQIQEEFKSGHLQYLAATNAFGMGVDIPDIRVVIHDGIPGTLEEYYQEIGRAGRDQQAAACYLLWSLPDLAIRYQLICHSHPTSSEAGERSTLFYLQVWSELQKLLSKPSSASFRSLEQRCHDHPKLWQFVKMIEYLLRSSCHHQTILQYFDEMAVQSCQQCDQCCSGTWEMLSDEKKAFAQLLQFRTQLQHSNMTCQFPLLPTPLLQYLALLQPSSVESALQIPGIGTGWITTWRAVTARLKTNPMSLDR